MKQNISFERKLLTHNFKIQEPTSYQNLHHTEKASDILQLKKQLQESQDSNKHKEELISALEKQLKLVEMEQKKLEADILRTELQYETTKLQNLQKKHKFEEQKEQQEEQNDMDMNAWLDQVQKYNGLSQSAIDSLISMEYESNPLDSDICLSCYKEMQNGEMSKYLPCTHLFHGKCIDEHLKISKVCPACMEEVIV